MWAKVSASGPKFGRHSPMSAEHWQHLPMQAKVLGWPQSHCGQGWPQLLCRPCLLLLLVSDRCFLTVSVRDGTQARTPPAFAKSSLKRCPGLFVRVDRERRARVQGLPGRRGSEMNFASARHRHGPLRQEDAHGSAGVRSVAGCCASARARRDLRRRPHTIVEPHQPAEKVAGGRHRGGGAAPGPDMCRSPLHTPRASPSATAPSYLGDAPASST